MSIINEDAKEMENRTMPSVKKCDTGIEGTETANLVRNEVNTMSIRSLMHEYMGYWTEKCIDSAFLEDTAKVFIDMDKFIDVDERFSAITKKDFVDYCALLRGEGKTPGEIMRKYSLFLEYCDWAEEHGAGSAKANYPKPPTDKVEDYEAMVEQIDALYEKNWTELWNSVVPKELR